VDINELDEDGRFPLARLLERMKSALDVERVTKRGSFGNTTRSASFSSN